MNEMNSETHKVTITIFKVFFVFDLIKHPQIIAKTKEGKIAAFIAVIG